jgi:D-3-phosphoglycerate dehydrogenase
MSTQPKTVLISDYAWRTIDIERAVLAEIGAEIIVAPFGEDAELAALVPGADAILVNSRPLTRRAIAAAQKCVVIVRYGVGVDNIDLAAATEFGIAVANVPDYCMDEVSNQALALVLCGARNIMTYDKAVRSGVWGIKSGMPLYRTQGLTLGIIGFGRIGRAVAPKAQGLGFKVIACDPYIAPQEMTERNVLPVDLDTLLASADFITLHVPLTAETKGLIGEATLHKMKRSAWLINTARGPVVDTAALYRALCQGRLAGAGLDVLPQEPPDIEDPLFTLPNVIFTPHSAFYSEGSLRELQAKAAQRAVEALSGHVPSTVVNTDVLARPNCRLLAGVDRQA